jgi:hypothetical protein
MRTGRNHEQKKRKKEPGKGEQLTVLVAVEGAVNPAIVSATVGFLDWPATPTNCNIVILFAAGRGTAIAGATIITTLVFSVPAFGNRRLGHVISFRFTVPTLLLIWGFKPKHIDSHIHRKSKPARKGNKSIGKQECKKQKNRKTTQPFISNCS